MTTLDPTVFAAALVMIIAAVGAAVVSVVNAVAASRDRTEARDSRIGLARTVDSTERKADQIIERAGEIHTLTNSNLSKMTARLDVALAEITGLRALIASQQEAKRVADALVSAALAPHVKPTQDPDAT